MYLHTIYINRNITPSCIQFLKIFKADRPSFPVIIARFHCAVSFVVDLSAMKRRVCFAARYNSDATHRITSSIRNDDAVDTEIPTPVPNAT
jgi:hypothetical protein